MSTFSDWLKQRLTGKNTMNLPVISLEDLDKNIITLSSAANTAEEETLLDILHIAFSGDEEAGEAFDRQINLIKSSVSAYRDNINEQINKLSGQAKTEAAQVRDAIYMHIHTYSTLVIHYMAQYNMELLPKYNPIYEKLQTSLKAYMPESGTCIKLEGLKLDTEGHTISTVQAYDAENLCKYLMELNKCLIAFNEKQEKAGDSDKDDDKAASPYQSYIDDAVDTATTQLMIIFDKLFSAGYGTKPNYGVFIPDPNSNGGYIIKLGKPAPGSTLCPIEKVSDIATQLVFQALNNHFKFNTCYNMCTAATIRQGYNYFPYLLLHVMWGIGLSTKAWTSRNNITEEQIATTPLYDPLFGAKRSIKTWKEYSEKLKKVLNVQIFNYVAQTIAEQKDSFAQLSAVDQIAKIKDACTDVVQRIGNIIVVNSYEKGGGIRLTIGDIGVLRGESTFINNPQAINMVSNALLQAFDMQASANTASINKLTCNNIGGSKVEAAIVLEEIVDAAKYNARPLFAYQALESLKERGEQLNWNNMLLGMGMDYNDVTIGKEGKIRFKSINTHIVAGSGAGKGVMTLNILAAAFANNIPVFYLDSKPDMAYTLRKDATRVGTDAFAINANWLDTVDRERDWAEGGPVNKAWNLNMPDWFYWEEFKALSSYTGACALQYFNALNFSIATMSLLQNGTNGINQFGNTCVVVVDEFESFMRAFSTVGEIIDKFGGSSNQKKIIDVVAQVKNAKKDDPTVIEKANEIIGFFKALNNSLNQWAALGVAGAQSWNSHMFTLYQSTIDGPHGYNTNVYKNEGLPYWSGHNTGASGQLLLSTSKVFKGLLALGSDGIVGFEGTTSAVGSPVKHKVVISNKLENYINSSARYFCYVDDVLNEGAGTAIPFKPYLILNEASPWFIDDPKNGNRNILGVLSKGLGSDAEAQEIVNEICKNPDGSYKQECGFEGYVAAIGGIEYSTAIGKGYTLANYILQTAGYTGDIRQYLFDFKNMRSLDELLQSFNERRWDLDTTVRRGTDGSAYDDGEQDAFNQFDSQDNSNTSGLADPKPIDPKPIDPKPSPGHGQPSTGNPDYDELLARAAVFEAAQAQAKQDAIREQLKKQGFDDEDIEDVLANQGEEKIIHVPKPSINPVPIVNPKPDLSPDLMDIQSKIQTLTEEQLRQIGLQYATDTKTVFSKKGKDIIIDTTNIPAENIKSLIEGKNYVCFDYPVLDDKIFNTNNIAKIQSKKERCWHTFIDKLIKSFGSRGLIRSFSIDAQHIWVNDKIVAHGFFNSEFISSLADVVDWVYTIKHLTGLVTIRASSDMLALLEEHFSDYTEEYAIEVLKGGRDIGAVEYLLRTQPYLNEIINLETKQKTTKQDIINAKEERMRRIKEAKDRLDKQNQLEKQIKNGSDYYNLKNKTRTRSNSMPKKKKKDRYFSYKARKGIAGWLRGLSQR